MKCGIKVNDHQCKHTATSGMTIEVFDAVVYCCTQHYNMYKDVSAFLVPVFKSTQKVVVAKENEMFAFVGDMLRYADDVNMPFATAGELRMRQEDQDQPDTFVLLECDQWWCNTCWEAFKDTFGDYDIPIHMAQYCMWDPAKHDPATCYNCGKSTPIQKETTVNCTRCNNEGFYLTNNEIQTCGCEHSYAPIQKENAMDTRPTITLYVEQALALTAFLTNTSRGSVEVEYNKFLQKELEDQAAAHHVHTVKCGRCKGEHTTIQEVAQCYGVAYDTNPHNALIKHWEKKDGTKMTSEWYANAHQANKRLIELRKGYVKPAQNKNGHWVHYPS